MKPELTEILNAARAVLGVEQSEWDLNKNSRQSAIIKTKQLFCLLAFEFGYDHSEIGSVVNQHRTTVIHHINAFKDHCDIYPKCNELVEEAKALLQSIVDTPYSSVLLDAYISRCRSGMLILSTAKPHDMCGYWIAEDAKPFYPQDAFPKVTYETGPVKCKIKVTLDKNEEV